MREWLVPKPARGHKWKTNCCPKPQTSTNFLAGKFEVLNIISTNNDNSHQEVEHSETFYLFFKYFLNWKFKLTWFASSTTRSWSLFSPSLSYEIKKFGWNISNLKHCVYNNFLVMNVWSWINEVNKILLVNIYNIIMPQQIRYNF